MAQASVTRREVALERTFGLYRGRLLLWLALLLPVAATGAGVFLGVQWLVAAGVDPASAPEAMRRAARVVPFFAAAVWLLAGAIGGQTLALAVLRRGAEPEVNPLLAALVRRAPRLLAVTTLVALLVAVLGLAGLGLAAGLAWLPRLLLPALGATEATGQAVSLVVLLPLLVLGSLPAVWAFGRHVLAIPLAAILERSPLSIVAIGRQMARGHTGSILGLFLVAWLASNVAVMLCRLAGSLVTLLFAREYFRPIFGSGPLGSDAGFGVQLAMTLVATFVTLPLQLLPFAVFAVELTQDPTTPDEGGERRRGE